MGFKVWDNTPLYLLELELSHSCKAFLGSTSSMKIILKWRHFFPLKIDFVSSFDCRICNKSTFQESLLLIVLGISCEQPHILFDSSKINFKGQLNQISPVWQHLQMQNSMDNIYVMFKNRNKILWRKESLKEKKKKKMKRKQQLNRMSSVIPLVQNLMITYWATDNATCINLIKVLFLQASEASSLVCCRDAH